MADAIVSVAAERLIGLIEEQVRYNINLIRGAEEKLRSLALDLQKVRNVLDDAENRRFKDKKINSWLSRLEQTAYEMEDVLDEWDYALLKFQMEERRSEAVVSPPKQKVCSFIPSSSCLCFKKVAVRHNIGKKILTVKAKLDEILKEKDQYGFEISQPSVDPLPASWRESTSMIDLTQVHGRDADKDLLVSKLTDNGGNRDESCFCVLSIVGTGGLGKTTLAQMVYNHSRVEEFFELKMWVCVSDPFDLAVIAKGILDSIKVGSSPDTNNLDVLFKQVKESISGRKFLLVLDDVWTEDSNKWEPLKNSLRCGATGSKILVTSRSERVVKMMGSRESEICRPGLLSEQDCWLLLCRIALSGRNEVEFEDIGKEIAKKCKGLPLAVKTLGSLLQFQSSLEQWNNVLDSEIWQMEEVEVDLFPHLLLSYNELSPTLKRCFSYCAVFPKDTMINVDHLIQAWMSLGYFGSNVGDMELKGRKYFDILAMRSLFQDFNKDDLGEIQSCKMHDIVHDFAQFLRKKGRVEAIGTQNGTICRVCDPSQVFTVNEFCTLSCNEEPFPNFCDCLVRLRVLKFWRLKSMPRGIENFIHLRQLDFVSYSLSGEDLKIIFQLYYLQSLSLIRCEIEDIPKEIENLIHLRFLDLSENFSLKELPESMCNLQELHTVNNKLCHNLSRVPEGLIHKLVEFWGGIGGNKLELLKNFREHFQLKFRLDLKGDLHGVIQDARKAELRNEKHMRKFEIIFQDEISEISSLSWVWMDVLDALQPHPNLHTLEIWSYGGSKFPRWMVSPLNHLRNLIFSSCNHLTSFPPFGKLPCLEGCRFSNWGAVEVVGREFLGITRGEGEEGGDVIAFPKLKKLEISRCNMWKEWEDITVEEEESLAFSIMPCLTHLTIERCYRLTMLPHRLLRKASSLKVLDIRSSMELEARYNENDGFDWESISINNPSLRLITDYQQMYSD